MKVSLYLAGKITKDGDRALWREEFGEALKEEQKAFPEIKDIILLNPDSLRPDMMPVEEFFSRDVHLISISSGVVVNATDRIGPGTAQEILIAKRYGKPVVTVLPENSRYWRRLNLRGTDIIYRHPFLFSTSDKIARDWKEAALWMLNCLSGKLKVKVKTLDILEESRKRYLEEHLQKDEFTQAWQKEME